LALYIPFLSTDRLRKPRSTTGVDPQRLSQRLTGNGPVATVSSRGQALHIAHLNRFAYEQGIRPEQTLADAKAMVPDLVTHDDDPAADRRQLESLAVWAGCLSPIVHIEGEDTLIADVTGCERLFKGEYNLLRQAIDGLETEGFTSRGAIADTPGAAWALVHAHSEPAVIAEVGQTAAELAPLPVWSLRIGPKTTAALASVGVETIGSLWRLPRSSLGSRFGDALIDRIDQALGDLPEVLTPYRPRPVLTSRFHIGAATTRIDVLSEAIRRALERFCQQLERQVAGVRQVFVTFYCSDVVTESGSQRRSVTLHVDLSQPTRSQNHLLSLLTVLLDRLHLPAPAHTLMLWAREIDSLDGWQDELFSTGSSLGRQLGDLLDRLAIRLGAGGVVRAEPLSEHQPERAFRYVSLVGSGKRTSQRAADLRAFGGIDTSQRTSRSGRGKTIGLGSLPHGRGSEWRCSTSLDVGEGWPASLDVGERCRIPNHIPTFEKVGHPSGLRPLRLSPRPVEIAVTALVPEGPPMAFRLSGTQHTVVKSVGPERIETGWWRGPHIRRDYYRVLTETGRHVWLFRQRDTDKWFLHGWFD